MDPLLVQFYRQYMQQDQIYRYFFEGPLKGPASYQRTVLKSVINLIEKSIKDPEEEAVSDALMEHMGYLSSLPRLPESEAASEKRLISYFVPDAFDSTDKPNHTLRILIEEAPNLLAAGSNVGLRTWEASLHLAQYLYSNAATVRGANVLELGAGTGLVSLLCAGPLQANHVVVTDGLEHVVENIERNIDLNQRDIFAGGRPVELEQTNSTTRSTYQNIQPAVLEWSDVGTLHTLFPLPPGSTSIKTDLNLVLGADIIYAPDIAPPLANLLAVICTTFPAVEVLISGTVRNEHTHALFRRACDDCGLSIQDVDFKCPEVVDQAGFFHEQHFPIVIMRISPSSK